MKLDELRTAGDVRRLLPVTYSDAVGSLPAHMQGAFARWLFFGEMGGDFMRAVLTNDLVGAYQRADSTNIFAMRDFVQWLYDAPAACWREPNIETWKKAGGLFGVYREAGVEEIQDRGGES